MGDTGPDHHPAVKYRINGGSWTAWKPYYPGQGNWVDLNLDIAETSYIDFTMANFEESAVVSPGPTVQRPAGDS